MKKIHFKADTKLDEKIRKLSKLTGFSISHICRELLAVSFKTGIAKDLFWLYMEDHSDPFLHRELSQGIDPSSLMKDAFSVIETLYIEQEKRIQSLEKNHTKMVDKLVSAKQFSLADFLELNGEKK